MTAIEDLAVAAGARDLFALHRITPDRLVNVDGFGRGKGWAGNISVDRTGEPWLARALELGLFRSRYGFATRIFGPYWAAEAAAAVHGEDLVVVGGEGVSEIRDADLHALARAVGERISEVPVAKRLADQLEVTQAALAIASLRPSSVEEAGVGIATKAAHALSCEFGAVVLNGTPPRLYLAKDGWRPAAGDQDILEALAPVSEAARGALFVEQDVGSSVCARSPLSMEEGLVARAVVPLGDDGRLGILVVAHLAAAPRGFTSLCQEVLTTVAEAAEPILQVVLQAA